MSEAEARLWETFRSIHARRKGRRVVLIKSALIACGFVLCADAIEDLLPVHGDTLVHPFGWWLFMGATFFARRYGGDAGGWIAAILGMGFVVFDRAAGGGTSAEYMVVHLFALAAVAGARSRSAWYMPRSPKCSSHRLPSLFQIIPRS